jgi:hypothetical protein
VLLVERSIQSNCGRSLPGRRPRTLDEQMAQSYRPLLRIGAIAIPVGWVILLVSTDLHPGHQDPNDFAAAFTEYAASSSWIAVHAGQLLGYLLLIGGLIALFSTVGAVSAAAAAWGRLARACASVTLAAFSALQAIDGVTLIRAIDAWVAAPPETKPLAFAAAETVRWTEIGFNSLAFTLVGVTALVGGVALWFSKDYPRWLAGLTVVAGVAYITHGAVVAQRSFGQSTPGLIAEILFLVWTLCAALLMWRRSSRPTASTADDAVEGRGGSRLGR